MELRSVLCEDHSKNTGFVVTTPPCDEFVSVLGVIFQLEDKSVPNLKRDLTDVLRCVFNIHT